MSPQTSVMRLIAKTKILGIVNIPFDLTKPKECLGAFKTKRAV